MAVGVFLVESEGHDHDWSDFEVNQTLEGIYAGLDWWASLEPAANLSFTYEPHIRQSTTYEPIERSIHDDVLWVDEIMSDLGYSDPGAFSKAKHFNSDLRDRLGTDWAYSIFVADSDDSANLGRFTDDEYGWGYYGGPWAVMSRYSSRAYNSADYYRVVPAHETGHIFYATDEYDSNPVEYSGYLNCPDDNGAEGIMNHNTLAISASTRCQIGWVDSDGDGVLDVVDNPPETSLTRQGSNPTLDCEARFTGTATVVPLDNRNIYGPRNDITINRITKVEVRMDGGPWHSVDAEDGAYGNFSEDFFFTTPMLPPGVHSVEARATDTEGNVDDSPMLEMLTTESPVCSRVDAMPPFTDETTISVSADALGPVAGIELWRSKDGNIFVLDSVDHEAPWAWSVDVEAVGGEGFYRFYSVAFESSGENEPPPATPDASITVDRTPAENPAGINANYKPLVASMFAVILVLAGTWSSIRRPWKGGKDGMAVMRAFTVTSLPFTIAEVTTGVISLLTGQLSIPPLVGVGTAVDMTIFLAGIIVTVLWTVRIKMSGAGEKTAT